jgi:hypothetical protein
MLLKGGTYSEFVAFLKKDFITKRLKVKNQKLKNKLY